MNAHDLIYAAYDQFGEYLDYYYGLAGMPVPEVPLGSDDKTLTAFIPLTGTRGKIVFEVHETPSHQSLWICTPHPRMDRAHLWYEFVVDGQNKLKPNPNPHLLSTAYPWWWTSNGTFGDTDPWSVDESYDLIPGDDPPHWSPIFVVDNVGDSAQWDACKRVHDWMNGVVTGGADPIKAARPTGQDLTDRAKKSWPTFTLRGVLDNADMAGGDWLGDHSFTFMDADGDVQTGLGDVGVDWDMSVSCDNDVWYLSSNVRSGSLQVEIEAWSIGPNDYLPKTGTYLQALGRWVIDCGHSDPQGQFWAEIHPPELLDRKSGV